MASKLALELNMAHWPGVEHSNPFHDSPAWHRFPAMHELPFQNSFAWQAGADLAEAAVATQFPFFPDDCPAWQGHGPLVQILRRRSPCSGFGSGSLHAPLVQIRRRRAGSGALRAFSFSSFSFAG